MQQIPQRIALALRRARSAITIVAAFSICSLAVGAALATAGNGFALSQRDAIVSAAQKGDITAAYRQDDRVKAALLDVGGNVGTSLIASVTGLSVVGPLPLVAYRGWVGGIVSVDAQHRSRLREPGTAAYYLITVALQQVPFILTSGAGMYLGLVAWRRRNDVSIRPLLTLRIPGETVADVGWIWALALPLFIAASLFEFLQ